MDWIPKLCVAAITMTLVLRTLRTSTATLPLAVTGMVVSLVFASTFLIATDSLLVRSTALVVCSLSAFSAWILASRQRTARNAQQSTQVRSGTSTSETMLGVATGVSSLLLLATHLGPTAFLDYRWQATTHCLLLPVLLGIALANALTLTFFTPAAETSKSSSASEWTRVSYFVLAASLVAIGVTTPWILVNSEPNTGSNEITLLLAASLPKIYFLVLATTHFTNWMVPQRVGAELARQTDAKSDQQKSAVTWTAGDWSSMAVAAWLVTLTLAVACYLPNNWPWKLL